MKKKNVAANITADDCVKIMKDNFDNQTVVEWCGKQVNVKRALSFNDMIAFAHDVVDDCYTKDTNTYRPEVKDFSVRCAVVKYYTDVELPKDVGEMYEFLYLSDLIDTVHTVINKDQYFNLMDSINRRIDVMVGESISVAACKMMELTKGIEAMTQGVQEIIGGISTEDILALKNAMSGEGFEERLVAAYQKMKESSGGEE